MSNFQINFTLPWLLLLLIPAIIITLIPYFRLPKRYRRTRNRVVSIVLHMIIMVLCITVLSGMTFSYDKVNKNSEVVYVVDYSYSTTQAQEKKNQFITNAINESRGNFKVGVVAFGYKQLTVVAPSSDTDMVRESFLRFTSSSSDIAEVDNTATDVSSALVYASDLIKNKQGAKIVLVTDGIETDKKAINIINSIVANGIRIDAVKFPSNYSATIPDVQIIDVDLGNNIKKGTEFDITVKIQSSIKTTVTLNLEDDNADIRKNEGSDEEINYDNVEGAVTTFLIEEPGIHELKFVHRFNNFGLHRLAIKASAQAATGEQDQKNDLYEQNNTYYTYFDLMSFNRILILEGYENNGKPLEDAVAVSANGDANAITRININPENGTFDSIPRTAYDMALQYDQIILVNVANSDLINAESTENAHDGMPIDFDVELNKYVKDYGGGVFVVGGNDPLKTEEDGQGNRRPVPHAFNFEDMKNATAFADMLPVVVEDFKPPVALAIIVDTSGSMAAPTGDGKSVLYYTQQGAKAILDDGLTHRDYVCVVQLTNYATDVMPMTSARNAPAIRAAIDRLTAGDGTNYAPSILAAGQKLKELGNDVVKKRHIILISDGEPLDQATNDAKNGYADVVGALANDADKPVTFSMVQFGTSNQSTMENLAVNLGKGSYHNVSSGEANEIGTTMRNELKSPSITAYSFEKYRPEVPAAYYGNEILKYVSSSNKYEAIPELGGFFASREKSGSQAILRAPYVPLYSHWEYGKGRVGTFMSSLDNVEIDVGTGDKVNFTQNFLGANSAGVVIVRNIVNSLMPAIDIKPRDMDVVFTDDNYNTSMSIYSAVNEDERIRVRVYDPQYNESLGDEYKTVYMDKSGRATLEINKPGVHRIVLDKVKYENNQDGEILSTRTLYKAFSYSKEYNSFIDVSIADDYLSDLTTKGRGNVVNSENIEDIYSNIDNILHKDYDPRMLFIIISIILFLLDVAVRKFKFKWIHEIIRDRKERQKLMGK